MLKPDQRVVPFKRLYSPLHLLFWGGAERQADRVQKSRDQTDRV